jgi:hypothetical protein
MEKLLRSIAASAAFAIGWLVTDQAAAMPLSDSAGMGAMLESISITDKVQYSYGGRNYCWYDNGWNGPGWYVCGQYLVRGVGWGGVAGWRGWTVRGAGRVGAVGRVGGARVGAAGRVGGARVGGGRVGGGRVGGGRVGGGRVGGGRGGGGRGGGGRGGGRRSDIQLKHDITLLGHLDNGLGFYRFSYNGSDKAYVGVMAQEVQAVMPGAVMSGSDGYLLVRYDKLGLRFQTYERWLASGAYIPIRPTQIRH